MKQGDVDDDNLVKPVALRHNVGNKTKNYKEIAWYTKTRPRGHLTPYITQHPLNADLVAGAFNHSDV